MNPPKYSSPALSRLLCGACALVLGLAVLACALLAPGWAIAGGVPLAYVGLNTALCLALGGAALIAMPRAPRLAMAAGLAMLLLGLHTLLEPWHRMYAPGMAWQVLANADPAGANPHLWPGLMRTSAALAFALAGLALLLSPLLRARWRWLLPASGLALVGIAMPSLVANLLGDMLLAGDGSLRVLLPAPAALGLVALGLGLSALAPGLTLGRLYAGRADRRIFFTSLALLSSVSLVAGLLAVGIVGRYAMSQFQDAWLTSFRSNAQLFGMSLWTTAERGVHIVQVGHLEQLEPSGPGLQQRLERFAATIHLDGDSAMSVLGPDGRVLASTGTARFAGQFSVALALPLAPRLFWDGGWRVLTEAALAGGERVRLELALSDFNSQFARMNEPGRTAEARVCVAQAGQVACFPSRLAPEARLAPMMHGALRGPSQLAAQGESGVGPKRDYRGVEVIAAYGPIPGGPLGLVHKIDTSEFYEPLRRQLWLALLGMALLIVSGASILYWRTHPLVLGLVRTRARMNAILNNVPAGVLTFDGDGTIGTANRAAGVMFGYGPYQLPGMRLQELVRGGDGLLDGMAGARQFTGITRSGEELVLEVTTGEFMLGSRRKRIAILQDVRERAALEQALRQREASLAHAQQLAHIGSWERDIVSGAYYWSDETYRIFGIEPGGAAPGYEVVLAQIHPDDLPERLRVEQEALAGRRPYDTTFRVVLRDGVVKVIHSRAEVEFDAQGRALRLRGTVQDITEKTWADEQLRKREEEYRALVENSPDVVTRFDRALRCVYVNPAIASAPGLRTVIGCGRALDERDARAARWARAVRQALAGECAEPFEVAVGGGADRRHYQVQAVPEVSQGGQVAAVLATARDITAIKRNEQQLTESRQLLRELSAHRERVREEERKKIAREVHDELGQALTALRMDVALLRLADGPHSPALLARIQSMKEAVDRTIGIVRHVTSTLRPAALDLGLTAALEWQVDDFARRSGIACVLRAGEADVVLDDGQATALFRIVQESLTNVLKHADATEVEVVLAHDSDAIRLQVHDNGKGFADDGPPGRGKFGLMGMRERVLMLGGTVDINSAAGAGTSILVRLPLTSGQGAPALHDHD